MHAHRTILPAVHPIVSNARLTDSNSGLTLTTSMSRSATHESTPATAATRTQLLAAAAEIFAERGFRNATVREICRHANANVAAISYHFGDKNALYAAVLRETAPAPAGGPHAPDSQATRTLPPERKFRLFIREFLKRMTEKGPNCHHSRIMAREMIEPTQALDDLVNEFIRPQHLWFQELVRELTGPGFTAEEIRLMANSVVSQILFYKHCGAVIERLQHRDPFAPERLHQLERHITEFSLAAIHTLAAARHTAKPTRRRTPPKSSQPSTPR